MKTRKQWSLIIYLSVILISYSVQLTKKSKPLPQKAEPFNPEFISQHAFKQYQKFISRAFKTENSKRNITHILKEISAPKKKVKERRPSELETDNKFNISNSFFNFDANPQFKDYIVNKTFPRSIFAFDFNGNVNYWFVMICLIVVMSVVCFTQTCGHVLSKQIVMRGMCKPGPANTLIKRALLCLTIVVCLFASIYFLLNMNFDEGIYEEETLKSIDEMGKSGVIQYRDADDDKIEWSNEFMLSKMYLLFREEEEFRTQKLGKILLDKHKFTETLISLNTTLIQKSQFLEKKTFNLPSRKGNREVSFPLFTSIHSEKIGKNGYMFNSTITLLEKLLKKWENFKNNEEGKVDYYFTRKSYLEKEADSANTTTSVSLSLYDQYFNQRKKFVLEFGYQVRNFKTFIKKYYLDKDIKFNSFSRLNAASLFICFISTVVAVTIVGVRLGQCKYMLIFLWTPIMVISLLLSYTSIEIIGFGGILHSGCDNFSDFLKNYEFDSSRTQPSLNYTQRIGLENKVNNPQTHATFKHLTSSCGLGTDQVLNQELFTKLVEYKYGYFQWWYDNKDNLELSSDFFVDQKIKTIYSDLNTYQNLSKLWVTDFEPKNEKTKVTLKSIFDRLSSITDFKVIRKQGTQSMQNEIGNCSISRDQWVLDEKQCRKGYSFSSNLTYTPKQFSTEDVKKPTCFKIDEWSFKQVAIRYRQSDFKDCLDPNTAIKNTTFTYSEFILENFKKTHKFVHDLEDSIDENLKFFGDYKNKTKQIRETIKLLNSSLQKEEEYVDILAQGLFRMNQTNNCNFINKTLSRVWNQLCEKELKNTDKFLQSFSILAVISFFLALLVGVLGCAFFDNPEDHDDYREIEMEHIQRFNNVEQRVSYARLETIH